LDAMKRIWQEASVGEKSTLLRHVRQRDARLFIDVVASESAPPTVTVSLEPTMSLELAPPAVPRKPRAPLPTIAFEALADFDAATLGSILQRIESRTLLLALAGASTALMDRVYGQLPRRDAQLLKRQIEQQGPISLRDVAEAQRRVAALAVKLVYEGEIEIPGVRNLESAA
jgi:hypothetical protein